LTFAKNLLEYSLSINSKIFRLNQKIKKTTMPEKTYTKIRLKNTQVKNLIKLRDYLRSGELSAKFDMADVCENALFQYDTWCGSVGCAIGHGPYAGVKKLEEEDWFDYCRRVFINNIATNLHADSWEWLFSEEWKEVDNGPIGAAERIDILLTKGLPSDWKEQMSGEEFTEY
jgi:hypothetical protein